MFSKAAMWSEKRNPGVSNLGDSGAFSSIFDETSSTLRGGELLHYYPINKSFRYVNVKNEKKN